MRDRQSTKPGRALITPEDGSPAFYATITRADEPTDPGTPYNKATQLTDETAAAIGLKQPDPTVNDALGAINDYVKVTPATSALLGGAETVDEALLAAATIPVPVGSVFWIAQQTAPDGFLICDGSNIGRADYARLFAVIGTTFGAGDEATTFSLPDLRAKFIRGAGTVSPYSATFGTTKQGTRLNLGDYYHSTDTSPRPCIDANGAVSYPDATGSLSTKRYGYTSTQATSSGAYSIPTNYVAPYHIVLTPIIKY